MKTTNTPAFPTHGLPGMTLRDYFAAQALLGMLAYPNSDGSKDSYARWAYDYADEMMKARGD